MRLALCLFAALLASAAHASDVTVLVRPGAPVNGPDEYPTIQNAIDHAPEPTGGGRVIIRITTGTYAERIWIPQNRPRLTLLGLGTTPSDTVITAGHFGKEAGGTFFTETVEVNGEGFQADNLTFANTAGNVGQALAISVLADKAIFKHCRFLGFQDTLFANFGRQYYVDSYIEGAVDFIFGNASAVFDRVEVHTTAPGYITAQSRLSAGSNTGFVFRDSHLTFAPGSTRSAVSDTPTGKPSRGVFLGRPWRPYSRVVLLHTRIDAGLNAEGWSDWNSTGALATAFYAESGSTGPGANPAARTPLAKQLTPAEVQSFQPRQFLRGTDNWDPEAEAAHLP